MPWFSASKLRCFRDCHKKFFFQYIEGVSAKAHEYFEFGTLFHRAVAEMTDFNRALFPIEIQRMVDALRANPQFDRFEIKSFEYKVWPRVTRNGREYKFFGILDALAIDKIDGQKTILEFKSSEREWLYEDRNGEKHDEKLRDNIVQHSIYSMALPEYRFAYFIVTKHVKPRVQYITPDQFMGRDKILNVCDEIYNEMEFAPTAHRESHGSTCMMCDYKDNMCEAWF